MSRQTLTTDVLEGGSVFITMTFTDENGAPVVPTSVTWSLRNGNGAIVNSRSAVAATPATSITIVLSGDDLKCSTGAGDFKKRVLTVDAVYDSTLQSSIPLKGECEFTITNMTGVS